MKKINSSGQLGGMPINQGDMREVFNSEIWDAMEALLYTFDADTQGVIVSGCVISGSGPYDISEGIVYLNGEFMRLPAATGQTLPKYIAPAAAVNDNRVFADTTTKTAFITKSAELVGSAPGVGQYIAITSSTDPDDRRIRGLFQLRGDVVDALNNTSVDKALSANQGKVLNDAIALKVSKSGDSMSGPLTSLSTGEFQGGIRTDSSGSFLLTKVIDIGDWNMDSTSIITVAHGLGSGFVKIRSVEVIIRNDSNTNLYNLRSTFTNAGLSSNVTGAIENMDNANIALTRVTSGFFDSGDFDSTGYNRGWVTIVYEA
jgi:hypothetical protein